jgi:hypothetical protein
MGKLRTLCGLLQSLQAKRVRIPPVFTSSEFREINSTTGFATSINCRACNIPSASAVSQIRTACLDTSKTLGHYVQLMRDMRLPDLAMAGGAGRELLRKIKYQAQILNVLSGGLFEIRESEQISRNNSMRRIGQTKQRIDESLQGSAIEYGCGIVYNVSELNA